MSCVCAPIHEVAVGILAPGVGAQYADAIIEDH
jgi:hypothetical protein